MKSIVISSLWIPGDSIAAIQFDHDCHIAEILFKQGCSPFGESKVYATGEDYQRLKRDLLAVVNADRPAVKNPLIVNEYRLLPAADGGELELCQR